MDDVDGVGNTFIVTFPAHGESAPGEAVETLQRGNTEASHA
jgi:hypothetical protein